MTINPDVLALARLTPKAGNDAAILAAEIVRLDRESTSAAIRERVAVIHLRHMKALKDYQKEKEAIDADQRKIMEECPHHETERHHDPSGGTDSATVCLICGMTW